MSANLRDVARAAGVALATASYALRGSPKIPPATSERVHAAARRIGYRVNPRFSELLAHIRSGGRGGPGERLGLLWTQPETASTALRTEVLRGARLQAARRGYGLEQFSIGRDGLGADRAAAILRARGIRGLLLGPLHHGVRAECSLPWERFASVVIGAAEWSVPLSRAAHHHFEAMRLALSEAARFSTRPTAWLEPETDSRAHRGWRGAWLAYAPGPAPSRLLLEPPELDAARLARWLLRARPDALIVSSGHMALRLRSTGCTCPILLLDRKRGDAFPGIHQGYASIAAQAVDLAISQLQSGEFGPPRHPRTLLFAGNWEKGAPA